MHGARGVPSPQGSSVKPVNVRPEVATKYGANHVCRNVRRTVQHAVQMCDNGMLVDARIVPALTWACEAQVERNAFGYRFWGGGEDQCLMMKWVFRVIDADFQFWDLPGEVCVCMGDAATKQLAQAMPCFKKIILGSVQEARERVRWSAMRQVWLYSVAR